MTIWYYARSSNQDMVAVLTNSGVSVPYTTEPQGEAIAGHGRERG